MKSIKNITKESLEGKWICKKAFNCNFEKYILIFRDEKITFSPMFFNNDYQLHYNKQENAMFLEIVNKDTIEIWQTFSDLNEESMIIKINDEKCYFEKIS